MLLAERFNSVFSGLRAAGLQVGVPLANSFLIVLSLAVEVIAQYVVQNCGRILPAPLGVFLQLRHSFGL
jgi:hypothetical protein